MTERKQRSDAQQNRERILVVAKEAFAKSGANASLDDIANRPGLGLERSTAIFARGRTF